MPDLKMLNSTKYLYNLALFKCSYAVMCLSCKAKFKGFFNHNMFLDMIWL